MSWIERITKKPEIPTAVLQEIDKILAVLPEYPIKEVRLFGSAIKSNWNPSHSDIDLAVLIKGNNKEWSILNRRIVGYGIDEEGDGSYPITGPTETISNFINRIHDLDPRFEIHLANEEDTLVFKKLGGVPSRKIMGLIIKDLHNEMRKGKLIYRGI